MTRFGGRRDSNGNLFEHRPPRINCQVWFTRTPSPSLSSRSTPRRIFVSPRYRSLSASDLPRRFHQGITNQDRAHLSVLVPPLFPPSSLLLFIRARLARNTDGPLAALTFVSYRRARGRNSARGKNWPRCAVSERYRR